ncbi:MAG: glycosyltransferase family 4 protein [Oribacterium sp.]|nr:glycosyltransferase family 4 protein [Oribacterium sp.]MBQ5330776.1 glycosyltransferase family 4 protein [Oscillospiraceae bacterium]
MRMKLLYIANVDLGDKRSGITRKVFSQYNVFAANFDAFLIGYDGRNIRIIHGQESNNINTEGRKPSAVLREEALNTSKSNEINAFYIRRMEVTISVLSFLKRLKDKNGVLLWEIPTYPYDFENKSFLNPVQKVRAKLRLRMDSILRNNLKKYVDHIVTFSHVDDIFGIKTIVTGNGVDVDQIRPRKIADHGDEIHMIAVAVMRPWHAYDRLIKGIKDYYDQGGTRNIIFHVVGDGSILTDYKNLVESYKLSTHVIFYGARTKDEIDEIYDKADIAVESLGWHRSKVPMGTSIKTREYVAKGLPIIASSPMDIFPEGWEYAYYAPIDESNINIQEIIDFYDHLISKKSKEALADEIREIAYKRCDMKIMMQQIIDYYNDTQPTNNNK